MKKVVLIIRASSDKQETESQKIDMYNYIFNDGYSKDKIYPIENIESATKSRELKGLNEMLQVIDDNPIETIYCWDLSRLSRIGVVLESIRNLCIDKKIQMVCKQQNFRLLEDNKEPNFNNLLLFDLYKNTIMQDAKYRKEASQRGIRNAAAENRFLGGKDALFGYQIVNKQYAIDEYESKIVQNIFELYETGTHSFTTIQKEILSKYSKSIHRLIVGEILNNRYYTGEKILKDGYKFERQYPALITKETFDNCTKILATRHNRKFDKSKSIYYAARLSKCHCGETLVAFGTQNQYKCKSFIEKRGCKFGDNIQINLLDSLSLNAAWNEDYHAKMNINDVEIEKIKDDINVLQNKVKSSENQLEEIRDKKRKQLMKVYETNDVPSDDVERAIRNEKSRINNENLEFTKEITRLQSYIQSLEPYQTIDDNGNEVWIDNRKVLLIEELSDTQRYDLVHQYIKHISITNLNKNTKEIVITSFNGNIYSYQYNHRDKNDMKKLYYTTNFEGNILEGFMPYSKNVIKRF